MDYQKDKNQFQISKHIFYKSLERNINNFIKIFYLNANKSIVISKKYILSKTDKN